MSNSKKRREHYDYMIKTRLWYSSRCLMGYLNSDAFRFICLIGPREAGKSFDIVEWLVKQWKEKDIPWIWYRLTDAEIKKLKQDNCRNAFESIVVQKYKLDNLKLKGDNLYCDGKFMCTFKSLSTFHLDKGTTLYQADSKKPIHCLLDEMNKEDGAKSTGPVCYQWANSLETAVRSRQGGIRIFMIGNMTGLSSILAGCFNFIPLDGKFGIYKIRKKKAIIHYMPETDPYKIRRQHATANLIDNGSSTFTNTIDFDRKNIYKGRLTRPLYTVWFKKQNDSIFTVWETQNNKLCVCPYQGEQVKEIPMKHYLDKTYDNELRNKILELYDLRILQFRNLITQEKFKTELALLRTK